MPRAVTVNISSKNQLGLPAPLKQKIIAQDAEVEHEEAAVDDKSVHRCLGRSEPQRPMGSNPKP